MARIARDSQGQPQVVNETQPLQISFDRFRTTLGRIEQKQFQHTKLEDVLAEVERLERKQAVSSCTRKINSRIEPFLTILDRYARSVDSITQANPFPSSLIWGLVKILLVIASSHSHYLDKLIEAIEDISDRISRYLEYQSLLKGSARFHAALAEVFYDILVFLHKAKIVFSKRGFSLLWRNVCRTFEQDFRDSLRAISRHTCILETEIELAYRSEVIAFRKRLPDLRQDISRWLSPANARDDFVRESSRRTSLCGQWLLSHQLFREWNKSTQNRILWIVGPPGSGKTVLSASIIENIECKRDGNHSEPVAFFFCSQNSQHNQSTVSILATLIAQLIGYLEELPDAVLESYHKSMKCARPRISVADQPIQLIKTLCQLFHEVHIVIDGLDEAEDPNDLLQKILSISQSSENTRTLILSRDLPRLMKQFDYQHVLRIRPEDTKDEIDMYIQNQLSKLEFLDPKLRQKMFFKLSEGAGGVFLWVSLVLQSLKSATSTYDAMNIISNHPVGLNQTYGLILDKFKASSAESQKLINELFTWMCCAARPLRWEELVAALTVEHLEQEDFVERLPYKSAILEICSPLVEYIPDQDAFRFVHNSVREFLLTVTESHSVGRVSQLKLPFREVDGHFHIATACLNYLLRPIQKDASPGGDSFWLRFSQYSTSFWAHHLVRSKYDSQLERMMERYLSSHRRRLDWISSQLFGESSAFPLQRLVKTQKQLCKWVSTEDQVRGGRLDWIRDIEQILIDVEHVEGVQGIQLEAMGICRARTTYFEKLMVVRDLSREYTMSSRLDQGESWLINALQKKQEYLKSDELSSVWILNSLGIIYDQQQKVELAAATQEKALAIQEKHLGNSHMETIWTVNELGRVYRHLKRTQDSISMHSRALKLLRTSGDDLQVAWTLNTLARAYRQQRDPAKALLLHKEAITIQEKQLGVDHPHVLWAIADTGRCYRDQGKLAESEWHHRKCLEGRKTVLGLDHLDTLWAMNDLGLVLAESDKVEARKLHQQALTGQTLLLGATHRHTIWSKSQVEMLEAQIGRSSGC